MLIPYLPDCLATAKELSTASLTSLLFDLAMLLAINQIWFLPNLQKSLLKFRHQTKKNWTTLVSTQDTLLAIVTTLHKLRMEFTLPQETSPTHSQIQVLYKFFTDTQDSVKLMIKNLMIFDQFFRPKSSTWISWLHTENLTNCCNALWWNLPMPICMQKFSSVIKARDD